MRTLAIGDIHGSFTALTALLDAIELQPTDRLVFLGDYIDVGPDSKGVLECLVALRTKEPAIFLKGNHEEMILDARDGLLQPDIWQSCGGKETTRSYGTDSSKDWCSAIPDAHWHFLEHTVPSFQTENEVFVHGCLDPQLDLPDQPKDILYWETFDQLKPHKSGKRIICGHTTQRGGRIADSGFAVCIDTGPESGGWLTGLDVESGRFWQSNERGETRTGSLATKRG